MAFSVAFSIGLFFWIGRGEKPKELLRLPWRVWLLGVGGLFGYHFFYFVALRNAPAVQASLIAYLWPLLIVLLSSLLPGENLRWYHLVGALVGFVGAVVLIGGGESLGFVREYLGGYLAALVSALTWAVYSVLSRHWRAVPTSAVAGYCGVTAVVAWTSHFILEETIWPVGWQWAAVVGLGIGPVGLAFYVWDWGVKHGDIKALGAFSYLAPVLSTILLVAAGRAVASWDLAVACGLIVGGAVLASGDLRRRVRGTDT